MGKQEVGVTITGNAGPLFAVLGEASAAMKGMAKEMEATVGGLKGVFAGLAAPLMAITAVVGGKEFLKSTIEDTKNWTVEAQKLARVLNITTEQASVLNLAIGDIYGTQEEYLGAVAKLTKTLNTNEEAFRKLGVATRDSSGRLRDTPSIMADVNQKLMEMKAGTDRNIASAQIYGKSWMEVQRYLKLTPEVMQAAQEKAEKLNLIVGGDSVAAADAYRASMNDLEDTVKGLKIRLGSELLPVMTQFNDVVADKGPAALGILGTSIAIVRTQFEMFFTVLKQNWAFLKLGVEELANVVRTFAEVTEQVQARNLKGAGDAFRAGKERAKTIFGDFIGEIKENSRQLKETLQLMWGDKNEQTGPQQPPAGGKAATPKDKDEDKQFERLKASLEKQRFEYEKAGADRGEYLEFKKSQEADYWQNILATTDLSDKTRAKVQQEYYKAARAELKKHHDESKQLDDTYRERYIAEQMALLNEEEKAAEQALATGKITEQQGLDWKRTIENDKFELELAGLQDRLAVKGLEPTEIAKINGQIEALEAAHQAKMQSFTFQQQGITQKGDGWAGAMAALNEFVEASKNKFQQWKDTITGVINGVANTFATTLNSFLQGEVKRGQVLTTLWKGISGVMTSALSQIIAAKLKEWMVDKAISIWKTGDSAKKVTENTAETATNTTAAASGIFQAHSSIPWVGVAIAIAMIAAMMAIMNGITGRAVGGLITRPELTLMGEAGPEVIAPESSFQDYTARIFNMGANLQSSLNRGNSLAAGYDTQANAYASGVPRYGGQPPVVQQITHIHGHFIDSSERGRRQLGEIATDGSRSFQNERGVVLRTGQVLGGL